MAIGWGVVAVSDPGAVARLGLCWPRFPSCQRCGVEPAGREGVERRRANCGWAGLCQLHREALGLPSHVGHCALSSFLSFFVSGLVFLLVGDVSLLVFLLVGQFFFVSLLFLLVVLSPFLRVEPGACG